MARKKSRSEKEVLIQKVIDLRMSGLSQTKVSEQLKISTVTISKYENEAWNRVVKELQNQPRTVGKIIKNLLRSMEDAWKNWKLTNDPQYLAMHERFCNNLADRITKWGYVAESPKKVELSGQSLFIQAMRAHEEDNADEHGEDNTEENGTVEE